MIMNFSTVAYFLFLWKIQGKPDQSQVKDALQKLHKHMDSVFYKDFPFYIVLAYRLHK